MNMDSDMSQDIMSQGGFLAKSKIRALIEDEDVKLLTVGGKPVPKEDAEACLQQCSYDLRLGEEVYVVGKRVPDRLTDRYPYVSLAPGQFALLTTMETVALPKTLMGFITMRSQFKFQGLVNISGFHVDPSYEGKLLFAVQNVGPSDIRLKYAERTFTIFFSKVDGDTEKGREKKGITGIDLERIQLLGGASVTISKLKKDLDQLKFVVLVYTPLVVAVAAAILKLLSGPK